jgi:membrane protein
MIATAAHLARMWAERFIAIQGVDRAMALAAQAFSALIPLLIVYSAVVSRGEGSDFADALIDRFELSGASADSVREAFTSSQTVEDSISLLGLLLLVISALSFTRGMQRLYENAYGMPSRGMRNTGWGLAWLGLIALYTSLRPFAAGLFDLAAPQITVSLALAAGVWTATPYLLLGRRISWRVLMPGAVLAAVGMTGLAASSVIWFPRTLAASADQFGVMGVAFALLSWLVAAGFVLVIAATGGAVTSERLKGRWAVRPAPGAPTSPGPGDGPSPAGRRA